MKDFAKNLEKTRNTEEQMSFYEELEQFQGQEGQSNMEKFSTFPIYSSRQSITSFLQKYELFRMIREVPGSVVECGVAGGIGVSSFYHFCSIFEPYHYVRKIIGFDTFEGFTEPSEEDLKSGAQHMVKGGLAYDTFDLLKEFGHIHDKNRALGHIPKLDLVKGDISETMPKYLEENPHLMIAMLYLDLDLYKPTKDVIELCLSRVPKGGMIVFDELNHKDYPGETTALIETLGIQNLRLRRIDHLSTMTSYAIVD